MPPGRIPPQLTASYGLLLPTLFTFVVLLFFFATVSKSKAQQPIDRKAALGKPAPIAMRIKVVKGQTVRITLGSKTISTAAAVEYVVRDFPALGVIDTPKPVPEDRTKATIVYQSASQSKGELDMFTFSARYPKGYYAAPVQVIIELEAPESKIEAPASINFGSLILGDHRTLEMMVKNTGNIEFRKIIQLPPPLKLLEPADGELYLAPGKSKVIKVEFRPTKVASFSMPYAFHKKPVTTFTGNAIAPFKVEPAKLKLTWNQKTQTRQGEILVTNQAGRELPIKVHHPLRTSYLEQTDPSDPTLVLPSGESRTLTISIPESDALSFQGTLTLRSQHHLQNIQVEASPTPALIKVELPDPTLDRIDFGAAKPGEIISRTILIKNLGGTGSTIGLGLLPPFHLAKKTATTANTLSVAPRSSASFTLNFVAPAKQFGLYSDILKITTNSGAFSIRLSALVNAPESMTKQTPLHPRIEKAIAATSPDTPLSERPLPPPSPLPPLPNEETGEDHRSPSGFYTRDFVTREYSKNIPTPSDFALHQRERHSLSFSWKLPDADHVVFEMDMRKMLINQTNFAIESVWVPFHDVEFTRSDDRIYATIKNLNPSSLYEFRVLSVGTGAKYSLPSEPFGAYTLAPKNYRWLKQLLLILAASLTAFFLWRHWKKNDDSFPMPTYWPRSLPWPFD
ncbi:MAG: fibronectin type III domain-containing protein [Verrucomicrobiales bacterium]|nr:fibronectin type III domain-containing protein [Verrucomicrobiales bacterium]